MQRRCNALGAAQGPHGARSACSGALWERWGLQRGRAREAGADMPFAFPIRSIYDTSAMDYSLVSGQACKGLWITKNIRITQRGD